MCMYIVTESNMRLLDMLESYQRYNYGADVYHTQSAGALEAPIKHFTNLRS